MTTPPAPLPPSHPEEASFDANVPQAARRYNALLGGKDHFAPDRAAADQIEAAFPDARIAADENRRFVLRMVHHLAAEYGIRQFLDIGSGFPAPINVHEVAQRVHPDARIVYVDNDPMVAVHARALLTGTPEGRCAFVPGDLRYPLPLLFDATLGQTLDLGQPVAVLMMAVLHFVPDGEDPHAAIRTLLGGLSAGSYLALSHGTADLLSADVQAQLAAVAEDPAQGPLVSRTRDQIAVFADGLELLEPGVTPIVDWLPGLDPKPYSTPAQAPCFGLLARRS